MEQEKEILSGVVERIVYSSEETGYTVCEIAADDNALITVVGTLPFLAVGESIKVMGQWTLHVSYGRQFAADSAEKNLPVNETAIFKYLASGTVSGIGPVLAKRLVDFFKEKTLEVIEKEPSRLSQIKGITAKKALQISESYNQQFGVRSLLLYFSGYGLTPHLALKVWKMWKDSAIEIINDNPYLLCEEIDGIGFIKSDEIAAKMNFENDNPYRLASGLKFVLYKNSQNGHTFLPREKLIQSACDILDVGSDYVEQALTELIEENEVVFIEDVGGNEAVFLRHFYEVEDYIAKRLRAAIQSKEKPVSVRKYLEQIEIKNGIEYADAQKEAIELAVNKQVMVLTGGPGTGKTTTLKGILWVLEQQKKRVMLAAPTGRAAKRMEELTGVEAKTIHRLLEMEFDGGIYLRFIRCEDNPLECDIVIIDEASMADVMIFDSLLRAMPTGARLILVGDFDQLPPVGAGNVLKDIVTSGLVPVVKLTEIFRQASQSMIVLNSHKIIDGIHPDLTVKDNDFFFIKNTAAQNLGEVISNLCNTRLPAAYGYSPLWDIQVICPSRKGQGGTNALNEKIRTAINPEAVSKNEIKIKEKLYREGDKVMQFKNNYDIIWSRDNGENGIGIFNGDIGIIEKIDLDYSFALVRFEDRVAQYDFELIEQLELAYAITVHKSQGNEFKAVIMPCLDVPQLLCYRCLLYTGVTRAKERLIMVGDERVIYSMVENNRKSRRYSALKTFLGTEV